MFNYNGREYRNLVEQVLKNQNDISKIVESSEILNDYGLKIVGAVTEASELPDPQTYEGNYGDCYTVGTESDYAIYIFTRPFEGEQYPSWFNLGNFPAPGPQGPQGIQGPIGETGERGSRWNTGNTNPSVISTDKAGDMYLNTSNSDIFEFDGSAWNRVGNIKGAQGIQGIQGPKGATGAQGPRGPQGVQGEQGKSFVIKGILASADLLPTPSGIPDNEAYLVGSNENYNLYVQVNDAWVNVGKVTTVEGPAGPAGPQGIQGQPGNGLYFLKFGFSNKTITDASFPNVTAYCGTLDSDADNINFKNINIIGYKINVQMEKDGNLYIIESNILNPFEAINKNGKNGLEENTLTSYYKATITSQEPMAFTIELVPSFLTIFVKGYGFKNDTKDARVVYSITSNYTEDLNPLLTSDNTIVVASELYFTVPQEA